MNRRWMFALLAVSLLGCANLPISGSGSSGNNDSLQQPNSNNPNNPPAVPIPTGALSLRGNPNFQVGSLTAEEAKWHARALDGIEGSRNYANGNASAGDLYTVARDIGTYLQSLLMALRATGDLQFLNRAYEISELARASMHDAWLNGTTDGYVDWLWLYDNTNAQFYGKDTNWLDESIGSGYFALLAYAMEVNRDLDPRYAASADFWKDWLENHFLAKWYSRAGDPMTAWNTPYAAFYKPDVEPRSSNWYLAHYLWKLTGNTFYKDRQDAIVDQLIHAMEINPNHPTAYRWARQLDVTTHDWQDVVHANYYSRATIEMSLEGMPFFNDPIEMARFASTYRDVVYGPFAPGFTQMAYSVNGGDGPVDIWPLASNGLARWDSTGFLMNLGESKITGKANYSSGGNSKAARDDLHISGFALMAISHR